ncbi:50S ribosomal protein L7Ae [Fonticula alba]|uniref:60S ribosomal protein L7a n=1 Tax=Fonticula alba TaxID=691883 RepID=A0A058ZFD6_FONAL|nr:50S ribosomal protein L7Ae [Fonticula alba]KCV72666.1 50S ribosomal protein L7Ae [Fonticula alba]|eukprot:XP_009492367.1 50S ribosomal protein L7Ae [Fonticula alba]
MSKVATKGKMPATASSAETPFESRPKNFSIGGTVQPTRDLTRYVKWPKYIRVQRQRAVLKARLKVPPTLNQFKKTLDKNGAVSLFKLLNKYRPETSVEKKARLQAIAQAKADGKEPEATPKPVYVKYGLNHVTALIEAKKAKLVVIADDVDPIELVCWLPALCRKMDVPYVIVKGKARLGTVVHMKNAAALAITDVRPEDAQELATLTQLAKAKYNDRFDEARRHWGGGVLGYKSQQAIIKRERAKAKELNTA